MKIYARKVSESLIFFSIRRKTIKKKFQVLLSVKIWKIGNCEQKMEIKI